jgi:RNA polymerase sigma-70 factor (ECF subfamily)
MLLMSGAAPAQPASQVSQLLERAATGDRGSEALLVQRLRPAMQAFVRRRIRGAEADELVQDAVLALIGAIRERRVAEAAPLGAFALGICRNLLRDGARAAERRAELWERYGQAEEPVAAPPPGDELFNRGVLEDCLAQLTQRARAVVRRAVIDGESNPEIAQALELKEGNVRVIRHRALAQLRECLSKPLVWGAP